MTAGSLLSLLGSFLRGGILLISGFLGQPQDELLQDGMRRMSRRFVHGFSDVNSSRPNPILRRVELVEWRTFKPLPS